MLDNGSLDRKTEESVIALSNNKSKIISVSKQHIMKENREEEVKFHLFLTLTIDIGVHQTQLDRINGGPHSWSGHGGKKNKSLSLLGTELWSSTPRPVTFVTELS
jgi:hypothetical protein